MAGFGVVVCGLATVWLVAFARTHDGSARTVSAVLAGVALLAAIVAVADAVVIIRRRRSDAL